MTAPGPHPTGLDLRLVPAALTSWAVTAAGIVWPPWSSIWVVLAAAVVAAAATWWASRRNPALQQARWPGVVAVVTVGVAFAISIGLRMHDIAQHPIVARYGTTASVVVNPNESPRFLGGSRLMFRGSLQALDGAESYGRVVVFASVVGYDELTAGRPVTFRARIGRPTRPELTVAVLSATGEPTLGRAPGWQRVAARVRTEFTDAARAVLPADQAAMLPALVLGDTSAVPAQTDSEFRTAGLTHLTAVSGANVTIVCGAVLLTAAVIGPAAAAAAAAVALVAFVAVVQPSASVLRAAVMGAIALFAIVSRRRRQAVPALSASVIVLMIVAPELAVDLGFTLSVVATAALVVIAPVWSRRLVGRGWPKPLADAVVVALAAQLVTAPIIAGMSGTFSVVSVIANLAVAVVIPPITVIGTVAATLSTLWPSATRLLVRFTGPELWWLLHVAHWTAAIPGASVPVPSGLAGVGCLAAAGVAVVVGWRWRWGRTAVAVALLGLMAWSAGHGVGGVGAVGPS
ncbi:MAG: competence protein ComEC [Mycobacterium sp.]|nr:competence protein ComEC [Mycobacterium sp.]